MKTAVATLTDPNFIQGTLCLYHSIKLVGYTGDFVVIHDDRLSQIEKQILLNYGCKLVERTVVVNPKTLQDVKRENRGGIEKRFATSSIYSKLNTWTLTQYDKVLFVDSDIIFHKSFSHVLEIPMEPGWIAATEIPLGGTNSETLERFNSGVFLTCPSDEVFRDMMEKIHAIESYDYGDQGFLCEYFKHRVIYLSASMNMSKRASPKEIECSRNIHYLNIPKPWQGEPGNESDWGESFPEILRTKKPIYDAWWRCYTACVNSYWLEAIEDLEELNDVVYNSNVPVEGNVYYLHETNDKVITPLFEHKRHKLFELAKRSKSVLEIGVNGGHSALTMFTANPDLSYHGFDIGHHSYTQPAIDWLNKKYKKVSYHVGDSKLTVPKFNKSIKFDLVHVDGGHSVEQALADIKNCRRLAHKRTLLLFDDCNTRGVMGPALLQLWDKLIKDKYIKELPEWNNRQQLWDSKVGVYV